MQTFAQQDVKGIIHYTNQTPVALADIIITNGEKIVDEISSDENGQFSTVLEEGTYTIRIEESGRILHTQQINIDNNQDLGLIIVPKTENVDLKEAVVTSQKKLIEKKLTV